MSSISKAGIFIDVKQLLEFTHRMVKEMDNADRRNYGDALVRFNLEMISGFTMAFHRRDERVTFEAGGKTYDINLRGEKRTHVDSLEAALAQLPELRARLARIGITMHPKKFYCQPCEHGVEFLGFRILPDRIHLKRRIIERALVVARSRERGKRNYCDAINSYLGMIKATTDLKWARTVLDAVQRPGFAKDYDNYKISIL